MRKISVIVLLILIIIASGCTGTFTDSGTATVTKTVTRTITKTMTQTETPEKAEPEVSWNLSENLSRCTEKLILLQETLNQSAERVKNLSEGYRNCLAELEIQGNASKSLKTCKETLTKTQAELDETKMELHACREKLEDMPNETASVEVLLDREYYYRVLRAIENSRESVYVMVFSMKYDPGDSFDWANDLIKALVSARRRGVEVHVLLEDSIENNRAAYEYLRSNGVDVSFDSPQTTLHAKVVVVDGNLVFIGSHNWSESALYWNHEVSAEIHSRELAERLIEYFNEAKSRG
ncbi:MAG: phospholipase [Thermococcus sp.]|nr:phospholipase [Thermococcus sp.]